MISSSTALGFLILLSLAGPFAATVPAQSVPASAPQQPATAASDWQQDLDKRRAALIRQNGPGTDAALRDRLLAMRAMDQAARGFHAAAPAAAADTEKDDDDSKTGLKPGATLKEIDQYLTAQLKEIFYANGWPTLRLVGIDASNAAMLILTHTADHDFQRTLLPQLEQLADQGRIDGSSLALVVDKELIASGKLQRYGSQFKVVNGEMAMYGVEDPTGLDARRAQVLLPPMEAYKQQLSEIYHLKVSKQIVSATPVGASR
jgi:hypothetical protein